MHSHWSSYQFAGAEKSLPLFIAPALQEWGQSTNPLQKPGPCFPWWNLLGVPGNSVSVPVAHLTCRYCVSALWVSWEDRLPLRRLIWKLIRRITTVPLENPGASRAALILGERGLYLCSCSPSAFASTAVILQQRSTALRIAGAVSGILTPQTLYGERVKGGKRGQVKQGLCVAGSQGG